MPCKACVKAILNEFIRALQKPEVSGWHDKVEVTRESANGTITFVNHEIRLRHDLEPYGATMAATDVLNQRFV